MLVTFFEISEILFSDFRYRNLRNYVINYIRVVQLQARGPILAREVIFSAHNVLR